MTTAEIIDLLKYCGVITGIVFGLIGSIKAFRNVSINPLVTSRFDLVMAEFQKFDIRLVELNKDICVLQGKTKTHDAQLAELAVMSLKISHVETKVDTMSDLLKHAVEFIETVQRRNPTDLY